LKDTNVKMSDINENGLEITCDEGKIFIPFLQRAKMTVEGLRDEMMALLSSVADNEKPLDKISLLSDGKELVLKSGDKFSVKKSFKVKTLKNVRVNVIGYGTKSIDESEQDIDKNSLNKSYSIDKDGKIYRVEFYKSENSKEKFAGMILAEFR